MSSLLIVLLGSVLVSYFALTVPSALQPFVSDDVVDGANGLALVTAVFLIVLAPLSWIIDRFVLLAFHIDYLAPVVFLMLVMLSALAMEVLLRRQTHWLPHRLGFVLLLTTQGAVLGVMLHGRARWGTFGDAVFFGAGAAISFVAMLLAFTSMQQRMRAADVPATFRVAPAALITIGIMALALMGLTGLVRE